MSFKFKKMHCKEYKSEDGFTVDQTNIAKGIACILLLFHHLFYSTSSYSRFTSLMLLADNVPFESFIAVTAKVCVAIFLLLSGYGINETLNKRLLVEPTKKMSVICRTTLRLLWKLWTSYIVIFLLFVPWQGLFGRQPYTCFLDGLIDFFGFAFLFDTPTMNATWWYMSVALLSYMLIPVFKLLLMKFKGLYIAVIAVLFALFISRSYVFWVFMFMVGMLLSEEHFFEYISKKKSKAIYNWIVCLICVGAFFVIRNMLDDTTMFDVFFALTIIVFSFVCISKIKYLNIALEFIGKHSGNIFMFHTFIYAYNFREFIYSPQYAPFILLLLLVVCLMISILIEFIKKITCVQKGIDCIGRRI